ncbi:MAG: MMPL family transporter [Candidatus Hydrogenedentes bacterium]|nr:MMPL family transporter [Candidatus Hydrogenedentota bacterium]
MPISKGTIGDSAASSSPLLPLFRLVTAYPKVALLLWGLSLIGFALQIPGIERESGADAYIPSDHPAVTFWHETNERFDLYEPLVVLIDTKQPFGIFNPQTLSLIDWYTEELAAIDGIRPGEISSIFTEKSIRGTEDGIVTEALAPSIPQTEQEVAGFRERVMGFPLHLGSLVARDGSAAVVAARLVDGTDGGDVYRAVLALEARAPIHGETIHVAGQPTASDYLDAYLSKDSTRMAIAVVVFIGPVLLLSYRTIRGLVLPGTSALFGAAVALGSMSILGVPFVVLTNVLPANIMALGVAYGIHILREYYEQTAIDPVERKRETVINVMMTMRRPIIYATLTDIVGFLAVSVTSYMPPMQMMGRFAALGIVATLVSTLIAIPAALVLLPVRPSPALCPNADGSQRQDFFSRILASVGNKVVAHPRAIVLMCAGLTACGLYAASKVEVNDSRIGHFRSSEPIYQAAAAFDRVMDGTLYLDVVIEADGPEALYRPENLARIENLQRFLESLPHIKGTLSIVDYMKLMNRAMSDDAPGAFILPPTENLVAQYALLYSMGDTTGLAHVVDSGYKTTVVRALCNSGLFSDARTIRQETDRYLMDEFATPGISARLSGRLNVDFEWMRHLEASHFIGALLALLTVWIMTSVGFRTWVAGVYCIVPVITTLVAVYAVMGISGIWLGLGTSAYASIAIGITVNFSIHELDRLVHLVKGQGIALDAALRTMFATTGRAVFFNFLSLILGMVTLTLSQLPPLQWFGILLSTALLVGFVTSLVLLPALIAMFRPRFLDPSRRDKGVVSLPSQDRQ